MFMQISFIVGLLQHGRREHTLCSACRVRAEVHQRMGPIRTNVQGKLQGVTKLLPMFAPYFTNTTQVGLRAAMDETNCQQSL